MCGCSFPIHKTWQGSIEAESVNIELLFRCGLKYASSARRPLCYSSFFFFFKCWKHILPLKVLFKLGEQNKVTGRHICREKSLYHLSVTTFSYKLPHVLISEQVHSTSQDAVYCVMEVSQHF